jgi:hypothetical protein
MSKPDPSKHDGVPSCKKSDTRQSSHVHGLGGGGGGGVSQQNACSVATAPSRKIGPPFQVISVM